jgi:transcriptional regulator with XRE-family HTH domain
MPVDVKDKLRAVTQDLGSQARVARLLGVSPSRVSRWMNGEQPDRENRRKLEGIEFVLARLSMLYYPDVAWDWLHGMNRFLRDHRPVDLLSQGRITEILSAIDAEEAGSYA